MHSKRLVTQLSYEITGYAIKAHKASGPGLLESVYEKCLKYELIRNGYDVRQQQIVPVIYDNLEMDIDLRVDLLVNDTVVVELKAVQDILSVHKAQLLKYMKLLKNRKVFR